jgi:protein-S-isoprenylcysteine O-methyltransferase Ste14
MAQDAALVVLASLFLYAHGSSVVQDGHWTSVVFAAEQGLLVFLFIIRRKSRATSTNPGDWVVAAIGGWLPLALRPDPASADELAVGGVALQVVGGLCGLVAFSFLGRSFGVVAANRGLKVNGPYRVVRHPIYAAHMITTSGFLLANPSMLNATLVSVITVAQLARISSEERLLTSTTGYGDYRQRVRWRLVPYLY